MPRPRSTTPLNALSALFANLSIRSTTSGPTPALLAGTDGGTAVGDGGTLLGGTGGTAPGGGVNTLGGTVANGTGIELVPRPLAGALDGTLEGTLGGGTRVDGTLVITGTLVFGTVAGNDGEYPPGMDILGRELPVLAAADPARLTADSASFAARSIA